MGSDVLVMGILNCDTGYVWVSEAFWRLVSLGCLVVNLLMTSTVSCSGCALMRYFHASPDPARSFRSLAHHLASCGPICTFQLDRALPTSPNPPRYPILCSAFRGFSRLFLYFHFLQASGSSSVAFLARTGHLCPSPLPCIDHHFCETKNAERCRPRIYRERRGTTSSLTRAKRTYMR